MGPVFFILSPVIPNVGKAMPAVLWIPDVNAKA
jgi:hypothetical protein